MKYTFLKSTLLLGAAALGAVLFVPGQQSRARADEIPEKYKKAVEKGLDWLASKQHEKGFWGANGDQYPITMTGMAGMALLMEGSTVKEGKYAEHIRKAVEWLMDKSQDGARDGLIGDTSLPQEAGRYMYGHGFATLFLASVYGDEIDPKKRDKLKDILTRAVKYIHNAQSTQGGWYYTAKGDNNPDQDEGSVTITQLQALRACRNAGIPVPKETINKAIDYLKHSTTERGGVVYSLGRGGMKAPVGGERPALTAAAISCSFSAGEYKSELSKKWLKYCQTAIPIGGAGARIGHDEYTHYYYAQALYILGDKGWETLFGPTPEDQRLTWTKYRDSMGEKLLQMQAQDGSFPSGGGFSVGTVYSTSVYLTILQLDKGVLPIYQR